MDITILKAALEDFKKNGIRQGTKTGLQNVIDYQDLIGRATNDEIYEAWGQLNAFERNLFTWACACCLSQETVSSVVNYTLGKDARRRVLKDLEDRYADLEKSENALAARTRSVEAREKEIAATVAAQKQIQDILNGLRG